ncbi:calponin homology domain-containing protein [Haematococcus lacustris]
MSTKSDLLGWINASLGLQLQRLEQLANGAVLCQLLDAYLGNVPMHKVNFFAREDYETITNWKVLQATFTTHNISKARGRLPT